MRATEWNTVEEHVADVLRTSQQEETVSSSPVTAALSAIWQQAAALENDVNSNHLAVIISARHVGKSFTPAECVAVADFLAAIEEERRVQQQPREVERHGHHQGLNPYPDEARVNGTGPHRVLQ